VLAKKTQMIERQHDAQQNAKAFVNLMAEAFIRERA
jgi:hypothetical protein